MNKIIAWIKNIRLDRILTVFIASLLLFVSTACSGGASAKTADEIRPEVPGSANTNQYKGGMNDYSDVDPRFSSKAADNKAEELVENAQKNIDEKSIDSVGQYVENYRTGTPLGERTKRLGEDVGKAAKDVGEDVVKGAQDTTQKAKSTAQDTAQKAKSTAQDTAETATSAAQDAANNAKRAADKTSYTAQDKVNEGVKGAQRAVDDTADKTATSINKAGYQGEKTLDKAADKSESLGDKIKQAAQDAAEAVKDTFD